MCSLSLKAFHIAFITLSALLTFGLAAYAFFEVEGPLRFVWTLGAVAMGGVLITYGIRFLKKMKDIGYL